MRCTRAWNHSTGSSATDERIAASTNSRSPRCGAKPPTPYRCASTCPKICVTVSSFSAGQHLTLRHDLDGEDVRRNYSVCVSPHENELRIAVKQIAGGVFSSLVNGTIKAGDVLEVMAPHGSFTWKFDPDARRRYVGFAGGSGITPILSLLKTALAIEPKSSFTLLYGNRSSATIMFLEELAALKNRFLDRLEVYHFLEDEAEEIELFNGRLDAAKTEEVLGSLVDATPDGRLLHLRPRPDDGRDRAGPERAQGRSGEDPDRALHRRAPERCRSCARRSARGQGRGIGDDRDARRPSREGRLRSGQGRHPRQRARRGPARAVCVQGAASARRAARRWSRARSR